MKMNSMPNPIKIALLISLSIVAYYTVGTIWIGIAFFVLGAIAIIIKK